MRILLSTLILLISFSANAGQTKIYHVEGMVCEFCATFIDKTLGKNKDIKEIKISMSDSTVTVTSVDGVIVPESKIIEEITKNGIDVVNIEELKND